jgi:hypothetical protein
MMREAWEHYVHKQTKDDSDTDLFFGRQDEFQSLMDVP